MKRKTQLEKAIEQLDSEMVALQRDHELKVSGIRAAIGVLREQKTRAPKQRASVAVAVVAEGRPA